MIGPSQRPRPDNTQQSKQTDVKAPGGIQTHHLNRRGAVDLRLRPCGHWDRPSIAIGTKLTESLNNKIKYPWEREIYGYGLYAFKYFHAQRRIRALWSLKLIKFWDSLCEKEHKITNTKLGTK